MIMMDTSLIGRDTHIHHHAIQGQWSPTETQLHINLLELRAVCNVCLHFLPQIINKTVGVRTSNITCIFYINWQGGARSQSLCIEAMRLWNWCISHNITVSASYCPGCQNITADILSRQFFQDHKWEIDDTVLNSIFQYWWFPSIDLFSTVKNQKCQQFCLCLWMGWNLIGDAFLLKWHHYYMHSHQPHYYQE